MLDADLAELYEVQTKVLLQAAKQNLNRLPEDFMFQLAKQEFNNLRSQFVTSSWAAGVTHLMCSLIMNPSEPKRKNQIGFVWEREK